MRKIITATVIGAFGLGACQTTPEPVPAEPAAQPAPAAAAAPANASELPAGTDLQVELDATLSTEESRVGDRFTVTVTEPLMATNGETVIPEGSVITGLVTGLDDSDHAGDQAAIRLNFLRISVNGVSHPFSADVLETDVRMEADRDERDVERAATVGAVAGAVLGAVIGGDLRDALVGAALGAGAGTIISLGTGDVEAVLPEGTRMTVRTRERMQLRR